ncbi:peptide/nickel transport system substrate-binding protein [Microvirga lupini]|uniref:Peptide/nickel transport system substrate-binding protein n=1 Tax=Microvirga lupini TaxID=420324 RepID=A0A7W4VN04_9HYPH|nr:ABC transporter substrate-binding protein [Microvirga lupini]MBB3019740.1 peptide/nickel transport system substrate-binding protein [Microvirga lupini]
MKKRLLLAMAAGLLVSTAASAQTLRIGLNEDPDVLDPHRARTFVGRIVFTSLCNKLVDITPDLKFTPELATEWSWSDDGKSLTFKLRPGVKFHDGEPMNAAAVKANIDRARTLPDSLRKSELTSVDNVEAVDDLTVKVNLSRADATLLSQLSDRAGMIMSPKALASADFGQKPVCSGPYKFVERVQNDRIVLEKFADHWDAKNFNFERVIFQPIPDTTVRLANLRSGNLDLLERLAPSDVPAVKSDSSLVFAPVTGIGYQGLTINTNNGERAKSKLGQDKRVRQALELSIDRNVINEVVGAGIYPPAGQPFPVASPYNNPKFKANQRDVAKAKQLLKEAGVDRVKFELTFGTGTTAQQIAEIIQAMAAETGFDITLRPTEFAAMQKEAQAGNFDVNVIGWSGRVDPDGNIHPFVTCKGALNDGKYCNEQVDKLLNDARIINDEAKRKQLYDQAQEILKQDLPIIYTYYQPWPFVHTKKVQNFKPYPDGMIRLKGVKFAS